MLVNTDVILDTLSAMAGMGEFQIVFAGEERPGAMERLVIRIEREADTFLAGRSDAAGARSGIVASRGRVRGARHAL